MKKIYILMLTALILTSGAMFGQTLVLKPLDDPRLGKIVNTRVDCNRYYKEMAKLGLTTLNPVRSVEPAVYTGSEIRALSTITEDSPDVPVTSVNSTQSENSIFVNPTNNQMVLNSNNSTQNPVGNLYGANYFLSEDGALTWGGSVNGAGGSNSGDPATAISLTGRQYVGFIDNNYGQSVSYSDNGVNWTRITAATQNGDLLDKNHLWIDNSPTSPHEGNLYVAYTDFGASGWPIEVARSTNEGLAYQTPINVSSAVNAGSHCQGVNIQTGPNGEVYVLWAIYDSWPSDESSMGLARSFDGGASYEPSYRIINNIRGIRTTSIVKNMRKNSFPSMACDISNGENRGNLYIVWANIGVPGINSGSDVDVYFIRSTDQGLTWSTPVKVNQDASGLGKKHYFPWITCDPENGALSVVFYDDRNVGSTQCEVYCANSFDGGETWEDFKVSDVAFTPSPIPGLADGYMGDYLGISARGGWVYPVWADNRTGIVMSYCSPYQTNPINKPTNLTASVTFETGITDLQWAYEEMEGFSYFKIYRNNDSIAMATDTIFNDQLPAYGDYVYRITAKYADGNESSGTNSVNVRWGDAQISAGPMEIEEFLMIDNTVTNYVTVNNIGQLPMDYTIGMFIPTKAGQDPKAYCTATAQCDEYIARVTLNDIDNQSECVEGLGYSNFTNISTMMSVGSSYEITIYNGNLSYPDDQCGLWVDWNQNEEFEDNESIPVNGSPGVGPYTATITPPVGALAGETRLRARIVYNMTPVPCGALSWGETEDYSVFLQSWLAVNPLEGTIPAGESAEIAVTMDATGMALGDYVAELNIYSNDPDDPQVTIPLTMHVVDIAVNLTASDEDICLGESVEITSAMTGGSGSFTYTWTSEPVGFTSSEQNVTVTPEVTTTYFLSVFDGTYTVQDQVTIQVNPLPVTFLGEDQTICVGDSVTLDAGAGFASYLWNTGDTTQTITAKITGEFSVSVTNEFGCSANDAMTLNVIQTVDKPVITGGDGTVDNYQLTSTVYTCAAVEGASAYQWLIEPANAGTTSSTGVSAEVFWTAGYTGTVNITVVASNTCFTSEPSDAFTTTVYSSAGLGENISGTQVSIYPNPTDGNISVRIPALKTFSGDLTLTDANGANVFNKTGVVIAAGDAATIDLGQLPKGMYTLKLSSKTDTFYGKVVIR
ncbi:MAG TPA: GEVED domain-containing protein [Bacteroidales bacterium]|nr:GEVED domain-containing protein [Bacteroidales bacterium]